LAVNSADKVLNYTAKQLYARRLYSKKELLYLPRLKLKSIPKSPRYVPVFIGEVRTDSGLELIPEVRIVHYKIREELPDLLNDALCGVNLVTQPNSCTRYTISSKIIDYLQHGLPVIVTHNVGEIVQDIKAYKLGFVINPYPGEVRDAVRNVYLKQRELTENVVKYVTEREYTRLDYVWKA
jgi:hypothetical protein